MFSLITSLLNYRQVKISVTIFKFKKLMKILLRINIIQESICSQRNHRFLLLILEIFPKFFFLKRIIYSYILTFILLLNQLMSCTFRDLPRASCARMKKPVAAKICEFSTVRIPTFTSMQQHFHFP